MLAASSRDALRRALVGIAIEIQGTDYSEVAYETGAVFLLEPPSPPYPYFLFLPVLDKAKRGN
jgi:hypothetical protein